MTENAQERSQAEVLVRQAEARERGRQLQNDELNRSHDPN